MIPEGKSFALIKCIRLCKDGFSRAMNKPAYANHSTIEDDRKAENVLIFYKEKN